MAERRDFVGLEWVARELEQTLDQAREALEAYLADRDDLGRLRFCIAYLHQVYGTLRMLEFHGAQQLAEELELSAQALLDGRIAASDELLEVMVAGLLELPAYIQFARSEHRDEPSALVPLVQDLRALRGAQVRVDSEDFSPDLAAASVPGPVAAPSMEAVEFEARLRKMRQIFQVALAAVVREQEVAVNLERLSKTLALVAQISAGQPRESLWQIGLALLEGLTHGSIPLAPAVKSLLRQWDREFKGMVEQGSTWLQTPASAEQLQPLLYYVARSRAETPRILTLRQQYRLDDALPAQDQEPPRPDLGALASVAEALCEELNQIKDAIDIHVRTHARHTGDLQELLPALQRVAGTISMLGLTEQVEVVRAQSAALEQIVGLPQNDAVEQRLLDIAARLIGVESAVRMAGSDRQAARISEGERQLRQAHDALMRECRTALDHAKECIVDFVASRWQRGHLEALPELLHTVRGALEILPLQGPVDVLLCCEHYVVDELLVEGAQVDWSALDLLADALSGVDYYLERAGAGGEGEQGDEVLSLARESVARLGFPVGSVSRPTYFRAAPEPLAAPAELPEQPEPEVGGWLGEVDLSDLPPLEEPAAHDMPSADGEPSAGEERFAAEVPPPVELGADAAADAEVLSQAAAGQLEASEIDEEILEVFREEVLEVLESLDESLPRWRANVEDTESLSILRRAFHTLKGSGRLVGAHHVGELAWSIENMLNRVMDHSVSPSAARRQVVALAREAIPGMMEAFASGDSTISPEVQTLIDRASALTSPSADTLMPLGEAAEAAAAPVEERDNQLQSIFAGEAATYLEVLDDYIASCAGVSEPELSDALQRALHTLKGSAHMADVLSIAEVITPIERLVKELRANHMRADQTVVDLLVEAADLLQRGLANLGKSQDRTIPGADEFILRVYEAQAERLAPVTEGGEGESVLSAQVRSFADDLDTVFRAVPLLHQWREQSQVGGVSPELWHEFTCLHRELLLIRDHCQQEDLASLRILAGALESTYTSLETGTELGETELQVMEEAHNTLSDLLDQMAAGQALDSVVDQLAALHELTCRHTEGVRAGEWGVVVGERPGEAVILSVGDVGDGEAARWAAESMAPSGAHAPLDEEVEAGTGAAEAADEVMVSLGDFAEDEGLVLAEALEEVEAEPAEVLPALSELDLEIEAELVPAAEWQPGVPGEIESLLPEPGLLGELAADEGLVIQPDVTEAVAGEALPLAELSELELDALVAAESEAPEQWRESPAETGLLPEPESLGELAADEGLVDASLLAETPFALEAAETVSLDSGEEAPTELALDETFAELRAEPEAGQPVIDAESEAAALGDFALDEGLLLSTEEAEETCFEAFESELPELTELSLDDLVGEESEASAWHATPEIPEGILPEPELLGELAADEGLLSLEPETVEATALELPELAETELEELLSARESEPALTDSAGEPPELELPEALGEVVDPDTLEIFLEEAGELLEAMEPQLHAWPREPAATAPADELKRLLHTFKGGARLTGLRQLGDLAHDFESMLERGGPSEAGFFQDAQARYDHLNACVEALAAGQPLPALPVVDRSALSAPAVPLEAALEQALAPAEPTSEDDSSFDPDMLEVFLEEARELLEGMEPHLHAWPRQPEARAHADELKRLLHTFKGGARLTGLRRLGDLAHDFESLLERAGPDTSGFFQALQQRYDHLLACVDALEQQRPMPAFAQAPEAAAAAEAESVEPAVEAAVGDLAAALAVEREPGLEPAAAELAPAEEVDADTLPIFLEEAAELLEGMETHLHAWPREPGEGGHADELKRLLHTFKGGARLTGLRQLGDCAHDFESLLESAEPGAAGFFPAIQQRYDHLQACTEALAAGRAMPAPPAFAEPAAGEAAVEPEAAQALPEREAPVVEVEAEAEAGVDAGALAAADAEVILPSLPDIEDQIDPETLEIFLEEAQELLEAMDLQLHAWTLAPQDAEPGEELRRLLHTFKGGARVAGLLRLGSLAHEVESLLEGAEEATPARLAQVKHCYELLFSGMEALKPGAQPAPVAEHPSAEEREVAVVEEAIPAAGEAFEPVEEEPTEPSPSNIIRFPEFNLRPAVPVVPAIPLPVAEMTRYLEKRGSQEAVKISAQLLEELVNLAGETSISRARVEEQVNDFRHSLEDMDGTINRLQDKLRRLDIETEAQMLFRQERLEQEGAETWDPLEFDRYSALQQLSRSLMETASDISDLRETLADKSRDLETLLVQQGRINTELQEGLMRSRMVPFARMVPRLRRIVRQVAAELGKEVEFDVINAEGEMDRSVMERMVAPLEHMLRNAVDHGIEMPDERGGQGKSRAGHIYLSLQREGGDIVLALKDDGRGINRDAVRAKAIERGLLDEGARLSEHEILQFIVQPGFSTAQTVTQISGRGVGMDVVHSEIKQLGGTLDVQSEFGNGSRFTVRLPYTVSVNRALMVNIGQDTYAIPLNTIEGIVRVSPFELEAYYQPDAPLFEYAGQSYRLRYLGALMHMAEKPDLATQLMPLPVLLVRGGEHAVAVQVDRLLGSREVVVKPLGPQFSQVHGLSGATVLGDGSVVVILDLAAMVRADISHKHRDFILGREAERAEAERNLVVMVVDDSVTVRKVTSRFLERLGVDVLLAKDGVDAMALLQEHTPDLMLLDIEMPRMDGFEVANRMRHNERLQHVPIIMITSRTGEKHRQRALSIGVNKYMGKPYQESELLSAIEELSGRQLG